MEEVTHSRDVDKVKSRSIRAILKTNKEDYESCREEMTKREELRNARLELNKKREECERDQFRTMCEFFEGTQNKRDITRVSDNSATINDLLEGLFKFYVSRKVADPSYRLYLRDFIHLFPRDSELTLCDDTVKVPRRQHVFEAICRVLLVLGYDSNHWGAKRKEFYPRLETYKSGDKPLDKMSILSNKINDGSAAGSVDIFFQVPKMTDEEFKEYLKKSSTPTCIKYATGASEPFGKHDLFVLVQNKFFDEEKGNADKYDINKIYNRANELRKNVGNENVQISLMVNNRERLLKKQAAARHNDFGPVNARNIFGLEELDVWFQSLLFDMLTNVQQSDEDGVSDLDRGFNAFYENATKEMKKTKPSLSLKFHQDVVVKTTMEYVTKHNRKKFVWGAVPRSGKSYMIGGLIKQRHSILDDNGNNVLLVLGAKTETEDQFAKDLFKGYDDFKDYNVVRNKTDMKKSDPQKKYILMLSQEMFKVKSKKSLNTKFEQLQELYSPILDSGKKLDFYFDEIHKGGTAEGSIKDIVLSVQNADIALDLFVMVTATYAKPLGTYSSFMDGRAPAVIEWSYEDNQLMKSVSNIDSRAQILDSRGNGKKSNDMELEKRVFEEVLSSYEDRYGPDYLRMLEGEYQKYPSLVLIQPQVEVGKGTEDEFLTHKGLFDLKCEAIPSNDEELGNPEKIFKNNAGVLQFLKFIGETIPVSASSGDNRSQGERDKSESRMYLNKDCVYGRLRNPRTYNYDVLSRSHSELWFLPDKNLYSDDIVSECRERVKSKELVVKGDDDELDRGDDKDNKTNSLPNIEPLARGLALNMMNSDRMPFKEYYCIAIVTNQKAYYYDDVKRKGEQYIVQEGCVCSYGHRKISAYKSIQDWIKEKESNAFKEDKNLIIMTGSMLRLGISLPCVDIALNFDTVTSVDTNYQTMFRVLTEREGKTHGYYLDFYRDRTIQFIYQFAEFYGKKVGGKRFNEVLDYTALLFNINGIALGERSTKESLKLYDNLIDELRLNETAYAEWALKNRSIKQTVLRIIEGIEDIDSLLTMMDTDQFINVENNDIRHDKAKRNKLVKGKPLLSTYREDVNNDKESDAVTIDESDNDRDVEMNKKEMFATLLETVIPVLAIFSNEIGCTSINKCFDKLIVDAKNHNGPLCTCNSDMFDVLACYLKRIDPSKSSLTRDGYVQLLERWRSILKDERLTKVKDTINISFNVIREQMGAKDTLIYDMDYEKIMEVIEKHLPVRKAEKDKYGEVFTPASLINEMFDQLPKKVWSDPNLKWLDPANGVGNFPMIAFLRLNKGLSKEIPDDRKRKEHIVKNMLYMVELNEKNVAVTRKVFGKDANVYCGSFLEDGWKKKFGADTFDVIMGNPPFQEERVNKAGRGRQQGNVLWQKFVTASLDILKSKGFLCFIHPANWRGLGQLHYLWERMSALQFHFLRIYSKRDGQQEFNVSTRFDSYVLENSSGNKSVEVIDELGKRHDIVMEVWPFLPNYDYSAFKKILTTENKGIDVIYNSDYHTAKGLELEKTTDCRLPIIHNITKNGIGLRFACERKGHFGIPKVILNTNEHQYTHKEQNDYDGKYGMSERSFGLPIKSKKEGEDILKAIDTTVFKTMIAATKWGAFQTDYRMFRYFRPDWYKIVLDMEKKQPKKKRTLKVVDEVPSKKTRKISSKSSSATGSKLKSRSSSKSSSSNKKGGKPKTLKRGTKLHKRHTLRKKSKKN